MVIRNQTVENLRLASYLIAYFCLELPREADRHDDSTTL